MAIGGAAEGKEVDVRDQITAFKRKLAPRREVLNRAYEDVRDFVKRAVDVVLSEVAAGRPVVPELNYPDIRNNTVPEGIRQSIRKTGCAVVRGVFRADLARDWFAEVGEYLETNHYEQLEVEKRSLDKYFSALKAGKPQVFNVYWSRPQVMARQDARLAETRAFLDRLWKYEGVFNPDRQCTYADRVRRRQPGDKTLGLSPHMDAGTVERWIDPGYQKVYENIFAGDWPGYDPFDATHRLSTHEIPSPAVCSMFRTYQGWTALTRQGPKDGTLHLIPIAEGIAYVLLRALQDDVDEADLCGGRPQAVRSGSARSGIPISSPAWSRSRRSCPATRCSWHTDTLPCRRRRAQGPSEYASVIYIGSSAPGIARRIAHIFRNKGEAFSKAVRPPTLPSWTSK